MYHKFILKAYMSRKLSEYELKQLIHILVSYNPARLEKIFSSGESIHKEFGIPAHVSDAIAATDAESVFNDLNMCRADMITEADDGYPQQLKKVLGSKCPPVLFTLGNKELMHKISIGFTGSREISPRGSVITENAARILAQRNINVVSGYASGSDMKAHTSALRSGGSTVFVLPEGILKLKLKPEIIQLLNNKNYLFMSQFTPYSNWYGQNALKRNETIIGLSRAVILTEAKFRSGTYSTGLRAMRYKHPLFVFEYGQPPVTATANKWFIDNSAEPIRGRNNVPNLSRVLETINI